MELSSEDALRLNVLIANAQAIRIDENSMTVYGLNGEQEMKFPLSPTGRRDQYLQAVRSMLSAMVLDSPGGYPVFLRRWTRMGQIDNDQLDRLLKLGEPEAVMAVVCARNLSDELARRAWWCAPYAEHARRMLESPRVVAGSMGKVLADYLIEHLPFETEPRDMLNTVRLVLQGDLIDAAQQHRLWESGARQKTYRIGFLETLPDTLPEQQPARGELPEIADVLTSLNDNPYALQLRKLLDAPGQSFLAVALDVLLNPADQEVASALFNALGRHGLALRQHGGQRELAEIDTLIDHLLEKDPALQALLAALPQMPTEIRAMLRLAHVSEYLLNPIFGQTDAVGTLMQEKIEPVTLPLAQDIACLRGQDPQSLQTGRRRARGAGRRR
ncbi:MAG: sulfur reduction protein DsrS [Chromatiales bacterium]|nr:sulfur reduction protein DsrS [Gammaproteobacteria bacterium]MBW6475473.1 sulfur reduction protein DsrS [Chromatiales bacterium]